MKDRDRLIELLKGNLPYHRNDVAFWHDEHIGALADYLIANGVTVNEWRPASEPPTEEGMYLCINEDGNHFEAYYSEIYEEFGCDIAIYHPDTLGFLDTEWQGYSVTHWMPLPQPPNEVK